MDPHLSIVVPCRADGDRLDRLLASLVAAEPVPGTEVVVAVHGDPTVVQGILEVHGGPLEVTIADASRASGPGGVRNAGVAASRGEHVVFLDADDEVDVRYLVLMDEALERHPVVASRIVTEGVNPPWAVRVRNPPQRTGLGRGHRPWAYGATLGVRRAAFDEVGGFDDRFRTAEDVDLCWRLQQAGHELAFVPDALLGYRLRIDLRSVLRQGAGYGRSNQLLWRVHRDDGATRPPARLRVRNVVRSVGGALRHPGRGSALGVAYAVSFEVGRWQAERADREP